MPMTDATMRAVRGVVQRHHVHFDVREELEADGEQRRRTGYRVRLWAVVSGKRLLPGDASASLFAAALRDLAQAVIPEPPEAAVVEVARTEPALYDSKVVPGADEIALDVLIRAAQGEAAGPGEERCLRAIRKTLESVGALQRD